MADGAARAGGRAPVSRRGGAASGRAAAKLLGTASDPALTRGRRAATVLRACICAPTCVTRRDVHATSTRRRAEYGAP